MIIGSVTIQTQEEVNGLRLTTDFEQVLLLNQTKTSVRPLIQKNFQIVKGILMTRDAALDEIEMNELSLKIVLRYLCLYNNWKQFYPKEKDRDLTFITEDLQTPATFDIVKEFILDRHPRNYQELSAAILGVEIDKFKNYEKARLEFMERR
jgi:hypothetical protein